MFIQKLTKPEITLNAMARQISPLHIFNIVNLLFKMQLADVVANMTILEPSTKDAAGNPQNKIFIGLF